MTLARQGSLLPEASLDQTPEQTASSDGIFTPAVA